jgi:hypothetical protein
VCALRLQIDSKIALEIARDAGFSAHGGVARGMPQALSHEEQNLNDYNGLVIDLYIYLSKNGPSAHTPGRVRDHPG